jgi:uncharacterized membrane protein (UPF0136 family)
MIVWEKYVKQYVWDDDKTPYFIAASKLKRDQADKEIFLFSFFLATPAALIVAAFVSALVENGAIGNLALGVYSASMLICAAFLQFRKSVTAALYAIGAPIVLLLYFAINGFAPKLHFVEQIGMIVIVLLWLRYTFRVVAITKIHPRLPVRDMNPWTKLPPGAKPPRK